MLPHKSSKSASHAKAYEPGQEHRFAEGNPQLTINESGESLAMLELLALSEKSIQDRHARTASKAFASIRKEIERRKQDASGI